MTVIITSTGREAQQGCACDLA